MIYVSKISYSIYLIVFLVLFYFNGTVKSGEEFHLSSYIDRLEILIVIVVATLFTLAVDLPIQNIVNILIKPNEGATATEAKAVEPDFDSPFTNEDDDFVFKPVKFRHETKSSENKSNGE